MNDDSISNDDDRQNTLARIRQEVHGQLRLNRLGPEDLFRYCVEVCLDEDLPEPQRDEFEAFIRSEIDRISKRIEAEQADWPAVTDCDRLDRAEASLREAGIVFWQASPCCDNCTLAEFRDRIDLLEERFPGFEESLRGYSFFIDQNLPERLDESTEVSVCLAYGWISDDDDEEEITEEVYHRNSLEIAREVCRHLHDVGFEVNWDGTMSKKICVSLNWQRRIPLV